MKIGLAIAMRREQLGMSQVDLAAAVGVDKSTVCRWESGDVSNIRRDRIIKLANALKISPLELLNDETDGFKDSPFNVYADYLKSITDAAQKKAAPDKVRGDIIDIIQNLSDSQAEMLRDFLKGFVQE